MKKGWMIGKMDLLMEKYRLLGSCHLLRWDWIGLDADALYSLDSLCTIDDLDILDGSDGMVGSDGLIEVMADKILMLGNCLCSGWG